MCEYVLEGLACMSTVSIYSKYLFLHLQEEGVVCRKWKAVDKGVGSQKTLKLRGPPYWLASFATDC